MFDRRFRVWKRGTRAIVRTASTAGIFSSALFLAGCGAAPESEEVAGDGEPTASQAESATKPSIPRVAYLVPQFWDSSGGNPFFKWQCTDFAACVADRNEADDGSIDIGLYSTNIGQRVFLRPPSIRDVAVNWDKATLVEKVEVFHALEASSGGYPCTWIGASIDTKVNGEDLYEEFEYEYCSTPRDPARSFINTLPAPGGGPWTWLKLNNSHLRLWARRAGPAGPRHYLAGFYMKVYYRAP